MTPKRFLLSLLWPAGALVFAAGGTALTAPTPAAKPLDGQALLQAKAQTRVLVNAQVLAKRASHDGQRVLTLETHQGLILNAYVAADAGPLDIHTGETYELTGTLASQKLLVLDQPNCLKPVPRVQREAVQAEVIQGWAMVPSYGLRVEAPGVPDGYHQGFLVSSGGYTRFEP